MMQPRALEAKARAVARLRSLQFAEGYWLGDWRGFSLNYNFGVALLAAGEAPHSSVLQDICDQLEGYQRGDGGFSHCAAAESQPVTTEAASAFLQRCRPRSSALPQAASFLRKSPRFPATPQTLLNRWILEPESRRSIRSTSPPARLLRHFAWQFAPRLMSEVPDEAKISPRRASWYERQTGWRALQALCWPLPKDLQHVARSTMPPAFGMSAYPAFWALQLLSPESPFARGQEDTARHVLPYVERYLYADGSTYYIFYAAHLLLLLEALGRKGCAERLRAAVRRVRYGSGGWLGTVMAGCNVFDTGLTLEALLQAGVPPEDPAIGRGCDFLNEARMPSGIWSWSWEKAAGPRGHRCADSDDTSVALLALQQAKSPHARARLADVLAGLARFQGPDGGLLTMDWGSSPLNPTTPSNTSRAVRALLGCGLRREDPLIEQALSWLARMQRADGTWFDYWITGPLYGTELALDTLIGCGVLQPGHPDVERAVHFVLRTQNRDGGWGFDWYGARSASTIEQTACAVLLLCKHTRSATRPIGPLQAGVRHLIDLQGPDGSWPASYVGNYNGIEGYASTSLPSIFSLRALCAYERAMAEYLPRLSQIVKLTRRAEPVTQRT